jgi:hypothetical protein
MHESAFGDPSLVLDQKLVHDRNLSRRTTKADESELQPESKSFPEGGMGWLFFPDRICWFIHFARQMQNK